MNVSRTYTMRARAVAVEETRRRILDATFALTTERLLPEIGLEAVAQSAGVSVQTVLRQFGNRAGLFEATIDHAARLIAAERRVPSGDLAGALQVLVDHYELRGDAVLLLLAQESSDPLVRRVVESGRGVHRTWVTDVFASSLAPLTGPALAEAVDLLVVSTDLYTWKLLRRDRGLDRSSTEHHISRLVSAVLAEIASPSPSRESGES